MIVNLNSWVIDTFFVYCQVCCRYVQIKSFPCIDFMYLWVRQKLVFIAFLMLTLMWLLSFRHSKGIAGNPWIKGCLDSSHPDSRYSSCEQSTEFFQCVIEWHHQLQWLYIVGGRWVYEYRALVGWYRGNRNTRGKLVLVPHSWLEIYMKQLIHAMTQGTKYFWVS